MPDRLRFWLVSWLTLWGLYMLLVFKTELPEIVAGAVCGAISATGALLVRDHAPLRFAPGRGWWRGVARLPVDVTRETWLLVGVLWRVLAKGVGSVASNTLVVGFDEQNERVLLHQLVRTSEPPVCDPWEKR